MARLRLIRALAVAAGALLAVELLLRAIVPAGWLTFSWERPDGFLMQDPSSRTFLPRPGTNTTHHDGPYPWRYAVNAQGLREDEPIPADRPGTFRVLALGDSWIFGISADQEKTLPRQLEGLLPERLGRPVEVINAGVPGAGAFDMRIRWRDLRDDFRVDALLLGEPHNYRRQVAVGEARETWLAGGAPYLPSYLYLGLRRILLPWTRRGLRQPDAEGVESTLADVRGLVDEARAAGLAVWFGVWPSTLEDAQRGTGTLGYGRWRAALVGSGARLTGHALRQRSCWGWEDHSHPSESGYRALAEVVAELAAGGPEPAALRETPSCDRVPGFGPTKAQAPPVGNPPPG